eukprot:PhF_6_TR26398/c2_g1_i5/m.38126
MTLRFVHVVVMLTVICTWCAVEIDNTQSSQYITPKEEPLRRLSRTALLWQLSSVDQIEQALTQNQRGLRRRGNDTIINGTICMYYRNRQGFGNQVYNHVMAIVIAALLGVDTMQMPESVTRVSNAMQTPVWTPIDIRQMINIRHYRMNMKRLGVRLVDKCYHTSLNNTFLVFTGRGRFRNFTYLERDFEAFLRDRAQNTPGGVLGNIAVTTSLSYFEGSLWTALFDPGTEPKKYRDQLNAYWPSNLFRAAYSMLRFHGHERLPPRPYGVFHLRAERDNIWMKGSAQILCWDDLRTKLSKKHTLIRKWYIASGRLHWQSFGRSNINMEDSFIRLLLYERPNHVAFLSAEDLNTQPIGDYKVERRAGMDYNASIESDVFLGMAGPSLGSVVVQMRIAMGKDLSNTYLFNHRGCALNMTEDYFMGFIYMIKVHPRELLEANGVPPYDGGPQPDIPKYIWHG